MKLRSIYKWFVAATAAAAFGYCTKSTAAGICFSSTIVFIGIALEEIAEGMTK